MSEPEVVDDLLLDADPCDALLDQVLLPDDEVGEDPLAVDYDPGPAPEGLRELLSPVHDNYLSPELDYPADGAAQSHGQQFPATRESMLEHVELRATKGSSPVAHTLVQSTAIHPNHITADAHLPVDPTVALAATAQIETTHENTFISACSVGPDPFPGVTKHAPGADVPPGAPNARTDAGTKVCGICDETLPLEEFRTCSQRAYGSYCMDCNALRSKYKSQRVAQLRQLLAEGKLTKDMVRGFDPEATLPTDSCAPPTRECYVCGYPKPINSFPPIGADTKIARRGVCCGPCDAALRRAFPLPLGALQKAAAEGTLSHLLAAAVPKEPVVSRGAVTSTCDICLTAQPAAEVSQVVEPGAQGPCHMSYAGRVQCSSLQDGVGDGSDTERDGEGMFVPQKWAGKADEEVGDVGPTRRSGCRIDSTALAGCDLETLANELAGITEPCTEATAIGPADGVAQVKAEPKDDIMPGTPLQGGASRNGETLQDEVELRASGRCSYGDSPEGGVQHAWNVCQGCRRVVRGWRGMYEEVAVAVEQGAVTISHAPTNSIPKTYRYGKAGHDTEALQVDLRDASTLRHTGGSQLMNKIMLDRPQLTPGKALKPLPDALAAPAWPPQPPRLPSTSSTDEEHELPESPDAMAHRSHVAARARGGKRARPPPVPGVRRKRVVAAVSSQPSDSGGFASHRDSICGAHSAEKRDGAAAVLPEGKNGVLDSKPCKLCSQQRKQEEFVRHGGARSPYCVACDHVRRMCLRCGITVHQLRVLAAARVAHVFIDTLAQRTLHESRKASDSTKKNLKECRKAMAATAGRIQPNQLHVKVIQDAFKGWEPGVSLPPGGRIELDMSSLQAAEAMVDADTGHEPRKRCSLCNGLRREEDFRMNKKGKRDSHCAACDVLRAKGAAAGLSMQDLRTAAANGMDLHELLGAKPEPCAPPSPPPPKATPVHATRVPRAKARRTSITAEKARPPLPPKPLQTTQQPSPRSKHVAPPQAPAIQDEVEMHLMQSVAASAQGARCDVCEQRKPLSQFLTGAGQEQHCCDCRTTIAAASRLGIGITTLRNAMRSGTVSHLLPGPGCGGSGLRAKRKLATQDAPLSPELQHTSAAAPADPPKSVKHRRGRQQSDRASSAVPRDDPVATLPLAPAQQPRKPIRTSSQVYDFYRLPEDDAVAIDAGKGCSGPLDAPRRCALCAHVYKLAFYKRNGGKLGYCVVCERLRSRCSRVHVKVSTLRSAFSRGGTAVDDLLRLHGVVWDPELDVPAAAEQVEAFNADHPEALPTDVMCADGPFRNGTLPPSALPGLVAPDEPMATSDYQFLPGVQSMGARVQVQARVELLCVTCGEVLEQTRDRECRACGALRTRATSQGMDHTTVTTRVRIAGREAFDAEITQEEEQQRQLLRRQQEWVGAGSAKETCITAPSEAAMNGIVAQPVPSCAITAGGNGVGRRGQRGRVCLVCQQMKGLTAFRVVASALPKEICTECATVCQAVSGIGLSWEEVRHAMVQGTVGALMEAAGCA